MRIGPATADIFHAGGSQMSTPKVIRVTQPTYSPSKHMTRLQCEAHQGESLLQNIKLTALKILLFSIRQ
jgi:hypothetical protein